MGAGDRKLGTFLQDLLLVAAAVSEDIFKHAWLACARCTFAFHSMHLANRLHSPFLPTTSPDKSSLVSIPTLAPRQKLNRKHSLQVAAYSRYSRITRERRTTASLKMETILPMKRVSIDEDVDTSRKIAGKTWSSTPTNKPSQWR